MTREPQGLCNNDKRCNIHLTGVPGKEKMGQRKYLKNNGWNVPILGERPKCTGSRSSASPIGNRKPHLDRSWPNRWKLKIKRKSSKQPEEKDMSHTEKLPACCQKHWRDETLDNTAGPDLSSQEHILEERRQNQSLLTSIPARHSSQGRTNETHREWLTFKKTLLEP